MNPRMDSTAALPYRLGYDYPRIAVEIAARNAPAPLTNVYRTGKHYHWLYGDTVSWFDCRKEGRQSGAEFALGAHNALEHAHQPPSHLGCARPDPDAAPVLEKTF